jgi:hypothetical protein
MQNNKKRPSMFVIFLTAVLTCLPALGADLSADRHDTGSISVTIRETGAETPLPCRAWVNVADERFFNPATKTCTPYAKDRSFSCDGYFVIAVPAGQATVHVERGKEYWPVDKEVSVQVNRTAYVNVTLKRWVNMQKEGWYSADMHCHFGLGNPAVLKQLALADDINFEPILTLWNHQRTGTSDETWPDWTTGSSIFADATHVVTLRNQEIERIGGAAFESVGALLMFGLSRPVRMPLGNSRYPCDAMLGRIAKEASPDCVIDTDKPIWGENVVGVALGLFDSIQVCHNHYHRQATLDGGHVGWGMAGPDIEDRQEDWGEDELFHRTNLTYYRFLNCGFRLAATGGSAMGVMPVPLGYSRTYAKLDGPLTEANYLKAIRAGRTFATSGPTLTLTADGLDSGAEIRYSTNRSKPIRIKADLRSIQPIDSLELINNAKVMKKVDLRNRAPSPIVEESLVLGHNPIRSGWIAARALFTSPDGRLRQAHTSPVYVTVDDKPTASKADAEVMIRWIDRLLEVSAKPSRYRSDAERAEVQAVFKQARQKYESVVQTARQVWEDQ